MTKPPLHNIDSLFQHKLEELPVDVSQQQAQWMALSQTMYRPTGFRAQLRKPWVKAIYMTMVALVPFGVFYLYKQSQTIESNASVYTPGSVANSLQSFNKTDSSIQTNEVHISKQSLLQQQAKDVNRSTGPVVVSTEKEKQVGMSEQPTKQKDSVRIAPTKQEKPANKKADSTYIYWQ